MPNETLIEVSSLTKAYRIWENPSHRLSVPLLLDGGRPLPEGLRPPEGRRGKGMLARKYRDFYCAARRRASPYAASEAHRHHRAQRLGQEHPPSADRRDASCRRPGLFPPVEGRPVSRSSNSEVGFNFDFTGRENVFLNGAIYGLLTRPVEMEAAMGEIAAFADIGDFMDQPVKTYSSGMMMRLAFAVAVNVQPDGADHRDEAPSRSATSSSPRNASSGSGRDCPPCGEPHSSSSPTTWGPSSRSCDRALLLSQGSLMFDGAPEDAVRPVFQPPRPFREGGRGRARHAFRLSTRRRGRASPIEGRRHSATAAKSRHGDRAIEIASAAVSSVDGHGAATWDFEMMHTAAAVLQRTPRGPMR